MYDRKVRIGARLANGEVVYLGQCVLHQLGFSVLAGKFREKESVPDPTRRAPDSLALLTAGYGRRTGRASSGDCGSNRTLRAEGHQVGCEVCAQATSAGQYRSVTRKLMKIDGSIASHRTAYNAKLPENRL